jgi:predicted GNAT family N-acyltransferase
MRARFVGDDAPDAAHYAAYDRADRIVGVVAVLPEATPSGLSGRRLRGMAVHPDERSSGIGTALLVRVFDGVARLGGGLLWCQARLPALDFYARNGFAEVGEVWQDPDHGPHIEMHRSVDASDLIVPPTDV